MKQRLQLGLALGALMIAGCGEGLQPYESQQVDGAVSAEQSGDSVQVAEQAAGTISPTCIQSWDAPPPQFVSASSPFSVIDARVLEGRFCLTQLSNCGTISRTYFAYAQNTTYNRWTGQYITLQVGGGQTVCQNVKFQDMVSLGTQQFRMVADHYSQVAETNEANNTWTGTFWF